MDKIKKFLKDLLVVAFLVLVLSIVVLAILKFGFGVAWWDAVMPRINEAAVRTESDTRSGRAAAQRIKKDLELQNPLKHNSDTTKRKE